MPRQHLCFHPLQHSAGKYNPSSPALQVIVQAHVAPTSLQFSTALQQLKQAVQSYMLESLTLPVSVLEIQLIYLLDNFT